MMKQISYSEAKKMVPEIRDYFVAQNEAYKADPSAFESRPSHPITCRFFVADDGSLQMTDPQDDGFTNVTLTWDGESFG